MTCAVWGIDLPLDLKQDTHIDRQLLIASLLW